MGGEERVAERKGKRRNDSLDPILGTTRLHGPANQKRCYLFLNEMRIFLDSFQWKPTTHQTGMPTCTTKSFNELVAGVQPRELTICRLERVYAYR